MIFDDQLAMAKKVQDRTEVAGITIDQEGTIFILHTPQLHLSTTTYFLHNVIAEAASMTFVPRTPSPSPNFFARGNMGLESKMLRSGLINARQVGNQKTNFSCDF